MPTQNVNLADYQSDFIKKSVAGGRYKNASEVVRAGLRLLESQESEERLKLEALRGIAEQSFKALDSGEYSAYTEDTLDDMLQTMDQRIRSRQER